MFFISLTRHIRCYIHKTHFCRFNRYLHCVTYIDVLNRHSLLSVPVKLPFDHSDETNIIRVQIKLLYKISIHFPQDTNKYTKYSTLALGISHGTTPFGLMVSILRRVFFAQCTQSVLECVEVNIGALEMAIATGGIKLGAAVEDAAVCKNDCE